MDPSWNASFRAALVGIETIHSRGEIALEQIPEPKNLAESALALSAMVSTASSGENHGLAEAIGAGVGRLVLLYDSSPQEGWDGSFRVVCYVKSPLDTEIGRDELIADVAWSWLNDALEQRGAKHSAVAATTTRILSRGFGELAGQTDHSELEIRASWSATDNTLINHVHAFLDLVAHVAALPPEGVSNLSKGQSEI